MNEERAFTGNEFGRMSERKHYDKEIIFSHSENIYRGIIRNISLGGAHIEADNVGDFSMGDIVTVCIPYTKGNKNVRCKGRIVRLNYQGFAIEFLH